MTLFRNKPKLKKKKTAIILIGLNFPIRENFLSLCLPWF